MDIGQVLLTIYLIVMVPALTLTLREQLRHGHLTAAERIAGLLACAAWPLTFPAIALSARLRTAWRAS